MSSNTNNDNKYKSTIHEVQYQSLSVCKSIETGQSIIIKPDENNGNQWTELPTPHGDTDTAHSSIAILSSNAIIHSIVPVTQMTPGATIRIPPMEWFCGGWDNQHFHDKLRLPVLTGGTTTSSSASRGLVVTLEAMGRECVAVALSPRPSFELGKTYVVHFGAASNIQTVIRRRLANPNETVDVTLPSPQICSNERYISYWIILQNKGQVSVGVGKVPGKQCIGTLDDSLYHEIRSGVDAVKYVGLGNSALGKRARDIKVRNVRVMPVPDAFFAFGGIPLNPYDGGLYDKDVEGGDGVVDRKGDTALWAEYQAECEKAKKRAQKFGIEYKQPQPDAFFTWSEARRLRANPERGFITGIDIMDEREKEKQRKRKERFEQETKTMSHRDGGEEGDPGHEDDDDDHEADDGHDNGEDAGMDDARVQEKIRPPLSVEQAWCNEELVGYMRVDPPEELWKNKNMSMDANDDMGQESEVRQDQVRFEPTKIHLFAMDWAAFKQLRTDDILSYFKMYGPTYVEWLGELSCNIHFEDKFSASRALEALSRVLPMEIPTSGNKSSPSNKDITPHDDEDIEDHQDENDCISEEETPISKTNLGLMGWRLCNYPIMKIRSDRFGKRGTRSRCIVRVATSFDVLKDRPSSWSKPPPGFTTHRVLGPGSDFKTYSRSHSRRNDRRRGGESKRRRRFRHGSNENLESISSRSNNRYDHGSTNQTMNNFDESAMDRALSAPR